MMSVSRLLKLILLYTLIAGVSGMAGCTDPKAVLDDSREIVNNNWSYGNKIKFDVQVDDPALAYNLYLNLRVLSDYKYSNIFVLIYQSGGPVAKPVPVRYECKVASATGEWLGKGSGSLYSYQIPFKKAYKFPAKGVYHFEIEQNMRDNPLRAVSDVGLRVEKATL